MDVGFDHTKLKDSFGGLHRATGGPYTLSFVESVIAHQRQVGIDDCILECLL